MRFSRLLGGDLGWLPLQLWQVQLQRLNRVGQRASAIPGSYGGYAGSTSFTFRPAALALCVLDATP